MIMVKSIKACVQFCICSNMNCHRYSCIQKCLFLFHLHRRNAHQKYKLTPLCISQTCILFLFLQLENNPMYASKMCLQCVSRTLSFQLVFVILFCLIKYLFLIIYANKLCSQLMKRGSNRVVLFSCIIRFFQSLIRTLILRLYFLLWK